jgi:hypothetical protein
MATDFAQYRLLEAYEREFDGRRAAESLLTKLVQIDDYLPSYGQDHRDFYHGARDRSVKRLLPLGWHFYRLDNIDHLVTRLREEVNPLATLYDVVELLEIVFHQYQAQIASNPRVTLSDGEVVRRVNEMNCKVVLMYGRKFRLFLAGEFDWQQFVRHPNMHLKSGRNRPLVISERNNRRDQFMNLPAGSVLRKGSRVVAAEKRRVAYEVAHDSQFAARVNRALNEPSHDSAFRLKKGTKPGIYRSRTAKVFRELHP